MATGCDRLAYDKEEVFDPGTNTSASHRGNSDLVGKLRVCQSISKDFQDISGLFA